MAMRARLNYYKENPIIIVENLPLKHNNTLISFDALFYDKGCNMITITQYTRNELLNLYK